ncbi:MAG: VCBS repeat-containing protein [Bacteroidota bacterium]
MNRLLGCLCVLLMFVSCNQQPTLFKLIDSDSSGITFQNQIFENDEFNIIDLSYLYNGGGVSVGDFDQDGLPDIFFTGNMVDNQLYLNRGDMKFEEVTEVAGVAAPKTWSYGSATIDINEDGLLDIYVCASILGRDEDRKNMLFVNQGLNDKGIPTFKDEAASYGLDDDGHSSMASFLDYDNDGDLDVFILSNSKVKGIPSVYKVKVNDGSSTNTDRLYRNNGDGTFTNVSQDAGILKEGFGLGISVIDVNKDQYPDIYVGNDYVTNDLFYVNEGGEVFEDQIDEMIKHQSRFSMGNDAADINNDGHMDIITLDMLPESNLRKKTVILGNGYIVYINDFKYGYTHQYVRNMLQLNNGNMSFSEIGQLAGIHQTEWSWSPLFADVDNDGQKDLLITNGFPRDITDNDFINYRKKAGSFVSKVDLIKQIPIVKIPNYVFKNKGNLTFEDASESWGFTQPSFSNGAAYADFDLDGDLDYVVNNINDVAFLYENTVVDKSEQNANYLRITLEGPKANPVGLGAKIQLTYDGGKTQYHEQSLYRGYVSTVEDIIHFGLGSVSTVDQLNVVWPDGKESILENVSANQVISISYETAKDESFVQPTGQSPMVKEVTEEIGIYFTYEELDYIDYNVQRNIPHKFSQYGPSISVGDINGDAHQDFFVGGSAQGQGIFFLQQEDGSFQEKTLGGQEEMKEEDMGSLLFDADNDGDLDLYLVSGGFEYQEGAEYYQDRLYLNDGNGDFSLAEDALPTLTASGSCVRAADYDADGDLDLFVGGRVVVGAYPKPASSYLLENEGGTFKDVTAAVSPELSQLGMITDGIWSDFNQDGSIDLVVVGEFLPISFFANVNGKLEQVNETGISSLSGWWNSISAGDFDQDGDIDYVAGNLGENNFYCASPEQPVKVTANDFDDNGFLDAVLSCYLKADDGSKKSFPVHTWDELNAQSPFFRKRFSKYSEFGTTTMDELFTPEELEGGFILKATHMATSYIENLGDGTFKMHKLPLEAQFAPVNGLITEDINRDGKLDIVMVGNDYGNEVNSGQYDAFIGLVLLGKGDGTFTPLTSRESQFMVRGDAKSLVQLLNTNGHILLIASQNRGPLEIFEAEKKAARVFIPAPLDASAKLFFADGSTQYVEFQYGAGFLSQSGRQLLLSEGVNKIKITDFSGNKREVSF